MNYLLIFLLLFLLPLTLLFEFFQRPFVNNLVIQTAKLSISSIHHAATPA
ncbi:MAG: hypothetical protein IGNPGNKH_00726 [Sodalis sp. Ffu]|nr:MAG: hypothetical protein IGNPGNKH_00726 [Sodalis sp. Ffu]